MNQRLMSLVAALVFIALTGCSGESSVSSGSGDLSVSLTDAASPDYRAVYVSVSQVEVKASLDDNDNGWEAIDGIDKTINLLSLTGGILEPLGSQNLRAQTYNQLRLILASDPDDQKNLNGDDHPFANYVIDTNNDVYELKVPSGLQSGIKLIKQFTISVSGLTEPILDFDAMKSVVKAGSSGQWLLKPVIQVVDMATRAEIEGFVTTKADDSGVEAASITAQSYDRFTTDDKDMVTTHAGTLTDAIDLTGAYLLLIPEDDYSLVVFKDGFFPECRRVTPMAGETITEDFSLRAATSGTLTVIVSGLTITDDSITVSIRKSALCGRTLPIFYEVSSHSFAEDGSYIISLPPAEAYTVVAYGENLTPTIRTSRKIVSGGTVTMTVEL